MEQNTRVKLFWRECVMQHHQVACRSVVPLVQRIKAAAHRDVSHLAFSELVQLYVEGCRATSTMGQPLQATTHCAHDRSTREPYRKLFDEWCLRSVFSSKWTEVDVDHEGFCSGEQAAKTEGEGPVALHQLGAWRYHHVVSTDDASAVRTTTGAHGSPNLAGTKPPPPPLTVAWSASLFATIDDAVVSAGSSPPVAAAGAVHTRQGGVRRLESLIEAIRAAPMALASTVAPPPSTTILVPFSTLMEIRHCAFHRRHGGTLDHKETLALHAALQLVRRVLSLQHHAVGSTGSSSPRVLPVQMIVVPPSAEIEALVAVRSLFPKREDDRNRKGVVLNGSGADLGPSSASGTTTAPSMRMLCESSTVRWASFSRFARYLPQFATVDPIATSNSTAVGSGEGQRGSHKLLLDVDGAATKRLAMDAGGHVASRSDIARTMVRPSGGSARGGGPGNQVHRSVVQQCGEVSKKLNAREENLRASFAAL